MIDTMKFADTLKTRGVEPALADSLARAMGDATIQELATKADLDALEQATKKDLDMLEKTLTERMSAFRWQVLGGVAVMLLVHLGGVYAILNSVVTMALRTGGN